MTDTPLTRTPTSQAGLTSLLDFVVVVSLILLTAGILFALVFVPIPEKNATLFAALSGGVVGSSLTAYVQWRWGSSKGSAAKDQTISEMVSTSGPVQ